MIHRQTIANGKPNKDTNTNIMLMLMVFNNTIIFFTNTEKALH